MGLAVKCHIGIMSQRSFGGAPQKEPHFVKVFWVKLVNPILSINVELKIDSIFFLLWLNFISRLLYFFSFQKTIFSGIEKRWLERQIFDKLCYPYRFHSSLYLTAFLSPTQKFPALNLSKGRFDKHLQDCKLGKITLACSILSNTVLVVYNTNNLA